MTEKEHFNSLTKGQKRFLKKYICMLCDYPLDRLGCGVMCESCSEEKRITKRENCLKLYKPRKRGKV
jgi:rubrerythrin